MGYINFKEERTTALKQLDKRINNNENLFTEIRKNKSISVNYNPDKKYSYKDFEEHQFGSSDIKGELSFQEVSNIDIVCAIFNKCRFSNIKFKNCRFIGCYFIECDFIGGGISFENCIFVKEESEKLLSLNRRDNFSCEFKQCDIYCNFLSCSLNYVIFDECNIKNTSFEITDMTSSIIMNSELKMIKFQDVNLSGAKVVSTYIDNLEFNDKDKSKIDEKTFIDKISVKKRTRDEYEGLYMVYENIANKFKENNLSNNFGEYYYLCKNMQIKTLKPLPKIVSFLYYFTCGYGERPLYAVYSSLIIIFLFSILYLIAGIDVNGKIVICNYNFSFLKILSNYNECLNLSVGMFAGVGFNNAKPLPKAYMLSNIEILIGVIMMGIGISTLTKKLIR